MEIILGSSLAHDSVVILEALTFLYFTVLFIYGNPNAKPLIANALGMLLYGGALMSLGMWISTFTKNQIIAGAVGWPHSCSFTCWTGQCVLPEYCWAGDVLSCADNHFDNFSRCIQLSDVVYYLSVVILGIFLTARSVEALKGGRSHGLERSYCWAAADNRFCRERILLLHPYLIALWCW